MRQRGGERDLPEGAPAWPASPPRPGGDAHPDGRLDEDETVFQKTGGTHAVALASPDGKVFIPAEDVGRHNAMDKVIGRAVYTRQDLTGLVALLSGRISFEMALKSIRPASRSWPRSQPSPPWPWNWPGNSPTTVGFVRHLCRISTPHRSGWRGGN